MELNNIVDLEQIFKTVPGGMAKLAFDDVLTILYATDTFYSLVKGVADLSIGDTPVTLLKMIYSTDIISVTRQLAAQKRRTDEMLTFHFRTLQHDGSFKWVMITGTKTEEVYQSGTKQVPVYSCLAMDVTYHMNKYKRLEQTEDYHRITCELARDIFFEYEIATDTLTFGEVFREVFGRESVIAGFRKKLEKTKLVHPQELPAVIQIFNSMMSGKKQARFEVRLIPRDGVPIMHTCYASIIFDENRNPNKVVGKLSANASSKKEAESDIIKPLYDGLTKVYTKSCAEEMIQDDMIKQEKETLSSLMLVDVRNYKSINQIMGSMGDENILATIAGLLKSRCRTSDIIGRISLSEFLIYVKDIPSDKVIYEKANYLCKEVEGLYPYEYTKNSLSISIGITFHKGDTQDFKALMANANTALVMAKKVNTSSFEVYYEAISNDIN